MVFEPAASIPREPARRRLPLAKSIAVQVLKFSAAAGVVVFLWERGDIAWEPLREALGRWEQSVPAFLLLFTMPLLQFWRWQTLLRANRLHLPHREVFSFLMASKFWNMAFPGHISGDILRGSMWRAAPASLGEPVTRETSTCRVNPMPGSCRLP